MQMVIFMKVNGKMINLMVLENTNIVMVLLIKANGKMINKMEKAFKYGLMDKNIKDIF
jgi:hypothetical protein